ncbi:uncharacterized protein OCT59_020316 [Rhizophagus irregularis]|uniref:uncharacterized protein n=1 Tax=Rhizophagus irregularis TaxID=588596 RepID=UPI0033304E86|nr:hypothetical protein OCT59_020316 [Rhizophagus irregularis]
MEPSIILLIHTSLLIISSLVNMKQKANQRLKSYALQLINSYPLNANSMATFLSRIVQSTNILICSSI